MVDVYVTERDLTRPRSLSFISFNLISREEGRGKNEEKNIRVYKFKFDF